MQVFYPPGRRSRPMSRYLGRVSSQSQRRRSFPSSRGRTKPGQVSGSWFCRQLVPDHLEVGPDDPLSRWASPCASPATEHRREAWRAPSSMLTSTSHPASFPRNHVVQAPVSHPFHNVSKLHVLIATNIHSTTLAFSRHRLRSASSSPAPQIISFTMESFSMIKRRTSDLFQNVQLNIPSMPSGPSITKGKAPDVKPQRQPEMKGTWERVDMPRLPRSSHSLSIIAGSAYLFGGEVRHGQPQDNDMHIVRLPYSNAPADYYRVKAKAGIQEQSAMTYSPAPASETQDEEKDKGLDDVTLASPTIEEETPTISSRAKGKQRAVDESPSLGPVPCVRVGHTTAAIGSRIFLFGGRSGPEPQPLEEAGRVWVFDIRSSTWSYLDPAPAVKGGAIIPHPSPRSDHCATATDRPRDFAKPGAVGQGKSQTWRDWAVGDISKTGIPQDPIVGHVAEEAVDEDTEGYGTLFVHAGCLANGDRANDLWAFDVRSRMWVELPGAPGPARAGTAICLSKSRLFRFGGSDGKEEMGGQLDFLPLEVETFSDQTSRGEVALRARGTWQSLIQGVPSGTNLPGGPPDQAWPCPRSVASLEAITVGGGREYLVLAMGEREPSPEGDEGTGKFLGDVWTFQAPPQGKTAASLTAAFMQAVGRPTGEGRWIKVQTSPHDEENEASHEGPEARGRLASAPMIDVEEGGIFLQGGVGEDGERLGDGWILRLG